MCDPTTASRSASIRVWSSVTGVEQTVSGDFSYLEKQDTNAPITYPTKEAYKTVAINQVIVILNRLSKVLPDTTATTGTLKGTVTTAADLPQDPATDDIYFITNGTTDLDDYYVKWDGTAWVETVKPGIDSGIKDDTMPHALVQTSTGFAFVEVTHENVLW